MIIGTHDICQLWSAEDLGIQYDEENSRYDCYSNLFAFQHNLS